MLTPYQIGWMMYMSDYADEVYQERDDSLGSLGSPFPVRLVKAMRSNLNGQYQTGFFDCMFIDGKLSQ